MTREEAIEKVREMKLSPGKDAELIIALHTLIPELRESEDEKIRKELIGMVKFHCADEHLDRYLNYLEKQKEQKPEERFEEAREKYQVEWSDNDDQLIGFIFDMLNDLAWRKDWAMSKEECLERLKSIRPQPKQEWSEEDEKMRVNILNALTPQLVYSVGKGTCTGTSTYKYDDEIKWLKSLRPSWKPSEEQMKHLHYALTPGSPFDLNILNELYEQLKKLM